jgi:hypothetical protein
MQMKVMELDILVRMGGQKPHRNPLYHHLMHMETKEKRQ